MNKSTVVIGSVLIFLGLFFLLRTLDLVWFDLGDLIRLLFPMALIGAGIWLMIRRKASVKISVHHHNSATAGSAGADIRSSTSNDPSKVAEEQAAGAEDKIKGAPAYQSDGKIRFDKMLGDMYIDCEGYKLSNFEVSMGIGDLDIKVAGGILSQGLNRIIISGFIGDMRIFVPKNFEYFAHCSNFVGDVEIGGKHASGFGNTIEHHTLNYDKAESKLYIAGNSFIGDIKIFSV